MKFLLCNVEMIDTPDLFERITKDKALVVFYHPKFFTEADVTVQNLAYPYLAVLLDLEKVYELRNDQPQTVFNGGAYNVDISRAKDLAAGKEKLTKVYSVNAEGYDHGWISTALANAGIDGTSLENRQWYIPQPIGPALVLYKGGKSIAAVQDVKERVSLEKRIAWVNDALTKADATVPITAAAAAGAGTAAATGGGAAAVPGQGKVAIKAVSATASSVWFEAGYEAVRAIDGDPMTGWSAADGDKAATIQIDLGSSQPISQIVLTTRQDGGDQPQTRQGFEIRVSNTAGQATGSYTVVGSVGSTPLPNKGTYACSVPAGSYRYVSAVKTDGKYFFIGELTAYK